jgi:hypothetical protein
MRLLIACFVISLLLATTIFAAPYAAIVINADTGEVLHEENADTRLHPAGLKLSEFPRKLKWSHPQSLGYDPVNE